MLDTLAVVDHSDGHGPVPRVRRAARRRNEGLLVAFLGDLDEEQAAVVARMRQRSGGAVAFAAGQRDAGCRRRGGPATDERGRGCGMLREAGWTALRGAAGRGAGRAVAAGGPAAQPGRAGRQRRLEGLDR